jgi:hypothetical protein
MSSCLAGLPLAELAIMGAPAKLGRNSACACHHDLIKAKLEQGLSAQRVPNQILIAFVAELTLYGYWGEKRLFAELLRILENRGAMALGRWVDSSRMVGMGLADRMDMGVGNYFCSGTGAVFACWAWYSLSQRSKSATAEGKS